MTYLFQMNIFAFFLKFAISKLLVKTDFPFHVHFVILNYEYLLVVLLHCHCLAPCPLAPWWWLVGWLIEDLISCIQNLSSQYIYPASAITFEVCQCLVEFWVETHIDAVVTPFKSLLFFFVEKNIEAKYSHKKFNLLNSIIIYAVLSQSCVYWDLHTCGLKLVFKNLVCVNFWTNSMSAVTIHKCLVWLKKNWKLTMADSLQ